MGISPQDIYKLLLDAFGHQHWWPVDRRYHQRQQSDPRFEIMVGAILTQNTAWTNVEKALENLKEDRILTIPSMTQVSETRLKTLIQPSGFFNQKAERLKFFASYLEKKYGSDLQRFFTQDTSKVRHELLSLQGIGPETADSILLYAGDHPVFVVDAYTKRICLRLPFPLTNHTYDGIQYFFQSMLSAVIPEKEHVPVYREYHALLVELAKQYCWKKKPHCDGCPLTRVCEKLL